MKYQKVQSYQVAETWSCQTHIATERPIRTAFVDLINGELFMKFAFCFEPSGPAEYLETKNTTKKGLRGYCIHDALVYLIRNGHLDPAWKVVADDLMHEFHIKDGMNKLWAWVVHQTVSKTDFYIDPGYRTKVQTAP